MTSRNRPFAVVTLPICAAILLAGAWFAGAGDLNPPAGPVAPTMKPLDEVEPRIAINSTNTPGDADSIFRITQSGSYYLTGNVAGVAGMHGIQIEVDGVTLDLSGYTLIGVPNSLDGINMPTFRENVVIRNGHVRNWGESGIEARIDAGRIEKITAVNNGAWGIDNVPGAFTTHIVSCEAMNNGDLVPGTGGIRGGQTSQIVDCLAFSNASDGITVGNSSSVTGCTANSNSGDGIEITNNCLVVGNTCNANGFATGDGAGIHATFFDNRIEGNNCTDADRGIDVDGAGNFIARNTCSGNATNWDIAANNIILVINATAAGGFTGNSGGAAPGSTDPNANFTY